MDYNHISRIKMKVIHIESGLGNQMLSYCEFLAIRKANPNDYIYIENIIFDIPQCNNSICQWNGYELERIFGIQAPNIKTLFSLEQWDCVMKEIIDSRFWILEEHNWNFPVYFTKALNSTGLGLQNCRGSFEEFNIMERKRKEGISIASKLKQTLPMMYVRAWKGRQPQTIRPYKDELFYESEDNQFTGHKLLFKYKGAGIELIEDDIRKTFVFPRIEGDKNKAVLDYIKSENSVAIHARRGDMLGANNIYYVTGYFKRAVKFIRKSTDNPVFFVFCDPESVQWAKENEKILGLNMKKDKVHFVDWNKGNESYRDMQLMATCKHQIITNSSFGWWAAWLNTNPDKITCSPEFNINSTHTF